MSRNDEETQMQIRQNNSNILGPVATPNRFRSNHLGRTIVAFFATLAIFGQFSRPQNTQTQQVVPHPIIIPQANRVPDANDQMRMSEQHAKQKNFDAANAKRAQDINDDATKLLILARDLNAEIDKLGDKPLPSKLLREAEVIEILAHDVQNKMTLTVGPS
jgi:hypothetical protein